MNTIRSVCVYCGSSPGRDATYVKAGHLLGRSLAKSGLRLVYGGGTKGIMGAVAEGALKAGGKVTGIIPRFLINREATETALDRLDELVITDNMHERKHRMFEKSDAFVALPGGIGTVEEIVEIMTWGQLGHHRKPIVFANIKGFWDPMLALLDHMSSEGFIHTAHRVKPLVVEDPEAIVAAIMVAGSSVDAPTEGVQSVIDKM
ncbi:MULTISPECIES: TIGR00730 family Rossman fold protein [Mesorhizobium]|uniref:Cytokinin riboside 5'-monophosphate phosphoribohydrolase n=1 Tax=Mesorhizobium abyssinicae TaxID=1209958 RepID=A0ABU5AVN3_9HYPH|nr:MULTISPECIES: TIGR00730 family Rossman fold protein [Mesorhizobium]MDX8433876.1 TIGR00730 family Rossman fold protein [Mesorhizobium abyssinicae]MDX8541323.1 TIGR00730 family Rossman fold protein [Mesorhizobium abyssinicae]RUW18958.1 TIGR00730 family Rossman fold protein [Mesorhizobium sp. M4B.F.Ca.ET.013.02.1.1]RUW71734.1 TIGR00730 family Rossman fold protein [Mesorhizobium sp. M4B.F.Ca.ET.049.02.1.2]RVD25003.1 TIGR00730 family Rossman fold protein [Mesorhizobium sp. M4B.F.Ca.ET.017.02.2.1